MALADDLAEYTDGDLRDYLIDQARGISACEGRLTADESMSLDMHLDQFDAALAEATDRKAAEMVKHLLAPGFVEVVAARVEQLKSYDDAHDDQHVNYELLHGARFLLDRECYGEMSGLSWPFEEQAPHENDQLAQAAAMIVAELDRRARRK